MVDFKTFKKTSGDLQRLANEIEKLNKRTFEKETDDTFWYPEVDKAGNGYAVIRFLPEPAVDGEDALPWVRYFDWAFQGPSGLWYIERSLTSLGLKDPVAEYNTKVWKNNDEDTARKLAKIKNTRYVSNILVIEDSKNPDNVGKVFRFRYGPKIFRKIKAAMEPGFDEEGNEIPGTENLKPVNPFDFWRGAEFRLRIRTVKKYRNYDQSDFVKDPEGQVIESVIFLKDANGDHKELTDAEIEKIWKSEYSLKELVSPDKFKSYEALKSRFNEVMDISEAESTKQSQTQIVKKSVKPATIEDNIDEVEDEIEDFLNQLKDE